MDLAWNDERTRRFVSNVGIITSDGPNGPNIMSAEWAHQISYAPSLMSVAVMPSHATFANIDKTQEFGMHLCAADQSMLASTAGGSSGANVDKIALLKELGFEFYEGEHIKPLLVKGVAMVAECKVVKEIEFGDHTMFVGEVRAITVDPEIKPLIYHNGQYWNLGELIAKPSQEKMDELKALTEKFKK